MVFVSQLNGDQVALDQETGQVKWSTPVVKPHQGFSITSAPLYYNGKVYVGGSGGEYGVRGRLSALNAETGEIEWRFYTTPAPNETGGDTWPNNGSYKTGGASIWNTPTVNPKTGMLFFSTSNAAPWIGRDREGENLFTASIVSLDAETGKYNCHFQEVHHDLWDYDAPSPTVLMTGEMNGEEVEAVGEPEKTGWAYVVDQENCKPVYPIPEVKVPQDPSQKTWPTQPEPTMEPFSPVEADAGSDRKGRRSASPATSRCRKSSVRKRSRRCPAIRARSTWSRTPRSVATTGRRPRSTPNRTCTSSARRAAPLGWSPRPKLETEKIEGETYIGSDTVVSVRLRHDGLRHRLRHEHRQNRLAERNQRRILLLRCGHHRWWPDLRRQEQR